MYYYLDEVYFIGEIIKHSPGVSYGSGEIILQLCGQKCLKPNSERFLNKPVLFWVDNRLPIEGLSLKRLAGAQLSPNFNPDLAYVSVFVNKDYNILKGALTAGKRVPGMLFLAKSLPENERLQNNAQKSQSLPVGFEFARLVGYFDWRASPTKNYTRTAIIQLEEDNLVDTNAYAGWEVQFWTENGPRIKGRSLGKISPRTLWGEDVNTMEEADENRTYIEVCVNKKKHDILFGNPEEWWATPPAIIIFTKPTPKV